METPKVESASGKRHTFTMSSESRDANEVDDNDPDRASRPVTDGGRRAWMVVVSGFIQFWAGLGRLTRHPLVKGSSSASGHGILSADAGPKKNTAGMLNSWGTFQAKYPREPWGKQTTLSEITWIGSLQVC